MDLNDLLRGLADPAAYPQAAGPIEVRQTHISVVFLTKEHAYKIKKPVVLPFVDYGTLERRRFFCEEEVRVDRRLAPDVYLGVVPIVERGGRVHVEGEGTPIEWAVKMRRLPDADRLSERLERDDVSTETIAALARKVARFHDEAESGPAIARDAAFEVLERLARDNFAIADQYDGRLIHPGALTRLRDLTDEALARLRGPIAARVERLVPRDTHGDLRLDHVYWSGTAPRETDFVIVDAIEFSPALRHADPVADLAFLAMDLDFQGRRDLSGALAEAYIQARHDEEGRAFLPFFKAYRAAVRAKVDTLKAVETEVPPEERAAAARQARAHWLLALGELAGPSARPALVLVGGLPGTGKSTVARALAESGPFHLVQTDQVRQEVRPKAPYSLEEIDRTYETCRDRAAEVLFRGGRVVIDATFRREVHRASFLALARSLAVPAVSLECQASAAVVQARLAERRDDLSEATWEVHQQLARAWEAHRPRPGEVHEVLDTSDGTRQAIERARDLMVQVGIA